MFYGVTRNIKIKILNIHPFKHPPLTFLVTVATQTPQLITLLALTASQIDGADLANPIEVELSQLQP